MIIINHFLSSFSVTSMITMVYNRLFLLAFLDILLSSSIVSTFGLIVLPFSPPYLTFIIPCCPLNPAKNWKVIEMSCQA